MLRRILQASLVLAVASLGVSPAFAQGDVPPRRPTVTQVPEGTLSVTNVQVVNPATGMAAPATRVELQSWVIMRPVTTGPVTNASSTVQNGPYSMTMVRALTGTWWVTGYYVFADGSTTFSGGNAQEVRVQVAHYRGPMGAGSGQRCPIRLYIQLNSPTNANSTSVHLPSAYAGSNTYHCVKDGIHGVKHNGYWMWLIQNQTGPNQVW